MDVCHAYADILSSLCAGRRSLDRGSGWRWGDLSLHCLLRGPPLARRLSLPVRVRVRSLVVGAGTPRSVSGLSFWSATSGGWDWSTAAGREGAELPSSRGSPVRVLCCVTVRPPRGCWTCSRPTSTTAVAATGPRFSQALFSASFQRRDTEVRPRDCCGSAGLRRELWRQLGRWPGPIPTCVCPRSPQLLTLDSSQWWELLFIQMVGRGWAYKASGAGAGGGGEVGRCRSKVPTAERRVRPSLLSCTGLGRLGRACGEAGGKGGRGFFHRHALSWSPLRPSLRPFRLSLCSWQQSPPHGHPPNPGFQHPASIHTSTHESQAGRRRAVTQTVHAGLTLSCLVAALSSEPLKLPSVPADLPTRKRGFPRLRNLSSFLHRGAGPFPFPLCFLLSCLVAWGFSYPLRCLRSSASVQHVLCENCPVPDVPGERWTPHAPIALSWPLTPPISVFFFFCNRGGRMVWWSLPSKIEAED